MEELLTGWLARLANADHVGITTQIYEAASTAEVTNDKVYKAAVDKLQKAIADEDKAYRKTLKDWNVDLLRATDNEQDAYMKAVRQILAGHAELPDSEPAKRKAQEMLQLWKDFDFKTSNGYNAESSKVINMFQEVEARQSDAELLGVWTYFQKAQQQAQKIQALLNERFTELSSRTVGEMKKTRAATDTATKHLYQVLTSLQLLTPSEQQADLIKKLHAIEDYARTYYLRTSAGSSAAPTETPDGGGD